MANVFTALQPTLFSAAREVASEPFGVIPTINTNFDDKGVARGDVVTVPVAPVRAPKDFIPAAYAPEGDDATAASVAVTITKSRKVDWNITGEQMQSLQNAESDKEWVRQLILQGARALRNEAEADAALAVKVGASRATGTAGTAPLSTNIDEIVNALTIMEANGAPKAAMSMVLGSAAANNLRKQGIIQQAQQAGSDLERRTGTLGNQEGFNIVVSNGVGQHTKGTGASYTTTTAGFAVGTTSIPLITGTGTINPGDIVTFAGDTNRYVVASGISAPGTITIAEPGLRQAVAASAVAVTVGNNYTANLFYERNAIVGVMRPPRLDQNPMIQTQLINDGTGMTYLLAQNYQYGQTTWELHLAWGFKTVTPMFSGILLG